MNCRRYWRALFRIYHVDKEEEIPKVRSEFSVDRGMARDRPSPYDKRGVLDTVARGPVPRDRCMARDRPSPYGKRSRSGYRSAGACPPRSWQLSKVRSAGACPPRSLGSPRHGAGNPLACACGMRGPKPYERWKRFRKPISAHKKIKGKINGN